jgi:endonuclease/exonuclease/phosphatase family metal-dependent hydrolase
VACLSWMLLAAACASTPPSPPDASPADLVVATFNIRYAAAREAAPRDQWDARREHVVATIESFGADVVGLQEALQGQVEYLEQQLPGYAFVGQGRDGGTSGEYAAILYDPERLDLVEDGAFWLSETPDVVASVGWDAALTRMVTWAEFADRASGRRFRVWNTHLDHRGERAREESGKLIASRIAASELPDLVLGDLNAGEGSPPLEHLRAAGLRDTFRVVRPDVTAVGTFGAWVGETTGDKIDYVLADDGFEVVDAKIDRRTFAGRNPSDHFPVLARVRVCRPAP